MPRNTEGLKRSVRLRSESTHARAMAALQRMEAADQDINFRAVSSEARVSTAWLYNQQELRDRITRLRKSQSWGLPASPSQNPKSTILPAVIR
jgi:acetaldehyde dehydrogenase (acetylating)